MLHAQSRSIEFLWASLEADVALTREQKRLMRQARESRLRDGACVPLRSARGDAGLMSSAASERRSNPGEGLNNLHLLAFQFHLAYLDLRSPAASDESNRVFTARQIECLKWSAAGKSSKAIAQILGIRRSTVEYHIRTAMKACNASNRVEAVMFAVRNGYINL